MTQDSKDYLARRKFFDKLLTIYGRKPCLEALSDPNVELFRLHLANSNKPAAILDDILHLAQQRGAEIQYHDKKALSRISRNAKQDQGVAADLVLKGFIEFDDFLKDFSAINQEFIALDRITNPQNLGMIIRSVCASPCAGLILPRKGCAKLDALVIKASAGTLFKTRVIRCEDLATCLQQFSKAGCRTIALTLDATTSVKNYKFGDAPSVFVLGNETEGLSNEVSEQCNTQLKIPMANGVESLNVAVTASLIAFRKVLTA